MCDIISSSKLIPLSSINNVFKKHSPLSGCCRKLREKKKRVAGGDVEPAHPTSKLGNYRGPFSGTCPNLASAVVLRGKHTPIGNPLLAMGTPLSQLRYRLNSGTLLCTNFLAELPRNEVSSLFFLPLYLGWLQHGWISIKTTKLLGLPPFTILWRCNHVTFFLLRINWISKNRLLNRVKSFVRYFDLFANAIDRGFSVDWLLDWLNLSFSQKPTCFFCETFPEKNNDLNT